MASYARISLNDLLTRLRQRLDGVDVYWTTQEKIDAINEALRVWQAMVGEWANVFSTVALSGTYLSVPPQITSLRRVSYNGTVLQLSSLQDMDMSNPGWETVIGTPTSWMPVGLNLVAFYPKATSGATILWEGIAETPQLQSVGDFINIGDEEVNRILGYAVHYAAIKEGTKEMEATLAALQDMIKAAALRNSRIKATTPYKRAMGLLKDEFLRPPRMPDSDLGARK